MGAPFFYAFFSVVLLAMSALFVTVYVRFRRPHAVICPEMGKPAKVRVKAGLAAATWIVSQPRVVVRACSRWPERAGCDHSCCGQIEEGVDGARASRPQAAARLEPR